MSPSVASDTQPVSPVSVDERRWTPTRVGLLNVWQYADEVLEFERGRLVLYGPNGSGKTMALELLLPHLLDAKGQPGRLSTSGAERGGLWERVCGYDEGEPRTGYLWLEFMTSAGSSFTAGVRLRAKPSGGGEKHWFTTAQRMGIDVSLLDESRRPLSVEQLTAAIGAAGKVWGADAGGYRHAVRSTLFSGWSEDRVDALIRTLLVVRKQNVTDGLSPARLSELLSEALPPLDETELGRVADGFADLDRRRDHITQLETDVSAARRLGDANRTYARAIVARVVGEVVSATTTFDNVARDVRRLSTELETCSKRVVDLAARDVALESEDRSLSGQLDGLKSSEAYAQGAALESLRQAADGARKRAREAEVDAVSAQAKSDTAREGVAAAESRQKLVAQQMLSARRDLETAGATLGAAMLADISDDALVGATRAWLDERERAISGVRSKLREWELAVERRNNAGKHQAKCEDQLARAETALQAAVRVADEARRGWHAAVTDWRSSARELGPYLPALSNPDGARAVVADARSQAQMPLIDRRALVQQRMTDLEAELGALSSERDEWLAGKDPEPEPPPGRRDRTQLSGAPLWRSIQFQSHVDAALRGSIESALADMRLLDAWIASDGRISISQDEADTLIADADVPLRPREQTLAAVVEADPAANTLNLEMVERLLNSLVLVEGDAHLVPAAGDVALIGRDGSWRTPRLAGRAPLGPARFVGASSREATRKARIAELERDIAEREAAQRGLQAEHELLVQRLRRCDEELQTFPPTADLDKAERAVEQEQVRVDYARNALVQASTESAAASDAVKQQLRELHVLATGHSLPTEPAKLDDIQKRISGVKDSAFAFQQAFDRADVAKRDAARTSEAASDAQAEAIRLAERASERRGEQEEAAGRFAAVEASVGADYRDVLNEIRRVTERRAEIQTERKTVQVQQTRAAGDKGSASTALDQAERRRIEADLQRSRAGDSFVSLCADGLPADAEVEIPSSESLVSATAILDCARRIRSAGILPGSPEDADLIRLSNTVMGRVGDASRQLAGRADLTFETTERGWSLLRARREGIVSSVVTLLLGLRDDLDAAKAELTQKQQELFEQILSGSVREHLKERLWGAQALVDRINKLLAHVRTEAGGVMVTLKWEINPDHSDALELRKAKELLLHDSPVAQGRVELDAFLIARIERVRAAEDDSGEWRDRLARMLDYRSWHRFRVLVHHNRFGETPRPLDSKKVSLSTGEKTIVMVLPLLAAVTAHYEPATGEPPCGAPRFLLMDELFPKLDFPNKRKLMALLPALHLDAVFTSDKDRCEYDTLDGIAIHVFQKLANDKTTTTRLVWNGAETRVVGPGSSSGQARSATVVTPVAADPA